MICIMYCLRSGKNPISSILIVVISYGRLIIFHEYVLRCEKELPSYDSLVYHENDRTGIQLLRWSYPFYGRVL